MFEHKNVLCLSQGDTKKHFMFFFVLRTSIYYSINYASEYRMKPEQEYKVKEFMSKDVVSVTPETSVRKAAEVMAAEHVSSALVCENKKLLGIITEKDLARKIVAKGLDADKIMAKDIMTTDVVTVSSNTSLYDAMVLINKRKIKHLPVVDNNAVVGIITAMEILRIQPSYMEILANPVEKEEEGSEF